MEQTTSRLRKTFHYPTDGDSDDNLPEALDEEEQDNLIQTLHEENQARNTQYAQFLLVLPLASTLLYLPSLLLARASFLLALLSITSLLSTAYLLYTLPPGITGIVPLDNLHQNASSPSSYSTPSYSYSSSSPYSASSSSTSRSRTGRTSSTRHPATHQSNQTLKQLGLGEGGPIAEYLPYLNIGLCVVLVLLGSVAGRRQQVSWSGFAWLPAAVQGVVILAKWLMAGVDPERELGRLRYAAKGA